MTMTIAKTLLAAAAAERIAALRLAYSRELVAQQQLILSRLEPPKDASPELRAVLAEVRSLVTFTEREGDCFPDVVLPTQIIRQAVAAGVMVPDVSRSEKVVTVGVDAGAYKVATGGYYPWTVANVDEYRHPCYVAWRAWRDAVEAAAAAGL